MKAYLLMVLVVMMLAGCDPYKNVEDVSTAGRVATVTCVEGTVARVWTGNDTFMVACRTPVR